MELLYASSNKTENIYKLERSLADVQASDQKLRTNLEAAQEDGDAAIDERRKLLLGGADPEDMEPAKTVSASISNAIRGRPQWIPFHSPGS